MPFLLGWIYLPGDMVIMGTCSAVISAACHCVPDAGPDSARAGGRQFHGYYCFCQDCGEPGTAREESGSGQQENMLETMSIGMLKWGVVSSLPMRQLRFSPMQLAHLAFGSPEQDVQRPEDGEVYAGI
jgi:hypothetical protein